MSVELDLRAELQRIRESVTENDANLIKPLRRLAAWYCDNRQPQRALPLIQEIWTYYKQAYGIVNRRTVSTLSRLASLLVTCGKPDRAESLLTELIAQLRSDKSLELYRRAAIWNQLVELYFHQSKLTEAFTMCRRVIQLLSDPRVSQSGHNAPLCQFQLNRARNNLGALHVSRGEYLEAQRAFIKNLKEAKQRHPVDSLVVSQLLSNLAVVLRLRGLIDKAQRFAILSIRECQRVAGNVHPLVAQGLSNLATYRLQDGRPISALSLFRKALKIRRELHPSNHLQIHRAIQQLADAHLALGNYCTAERLLERVRNRIEQKHPINESQLANTLCSLGNTYLKVGQLGSSMRVLELAFQMQETTHGQNNLQLIPTLTGLGSIETARGNYESAQRFYRSAIVIAEMHLGRQHPDIAKILIQKGESSLICHELTEAHVDIERALSIVETGVGPEHPVVAEALVQHGRLKLAQQQPDSALASVLRAKHLLQHGPECPPLALANALAVEADASKMLQKYPAAEIASLDELRLREQVVGIEHENLLSPIKRLVGIYVEQQSYDNAAPLLSRGMHIAESSFHNRDEMCCFFAENMAELCLARDRFEEASQWMERVVSLLQRRHGNDAEEVADALLNFSSHLRHSGHNEVADDFEMRAIDMRNRNCHVLL